MTTTIEWTKPPWVTNGETWNPMVGCSAASPGCDHCYAATVASRGLSDEHRGLAVKGEWSGEVRLLPDRLDIPKRWRKPRGVFVGSMTDVFHPGVPTEYILRMWETMSRCPQHTFMVLTKRPKRMAKVVGALCWSDWNESTGGVPYIDPASEPDPDDWENHYRIVGEEPITMSTSARAANVDQVLVPLIAHVASSTLVVPPTPPGLEGTGTAPTLPWWTLPNVWLGISVESTDYLWRIDALREAPAKVRFLSIEPLLGPLGELNLEGIGWVIVGGESGRGARPMNPDWVLPIRDQCAAEGVPFFFKQWGAHDPLGNNVGKKEAGRHLDGRTWSQYPPEGIPNSTERER